MSSNRFARPTYTSSQIQKYFHRISLPQRLCGKLLSNDFVPDLESLRLLQAYTVAAVPFESLSLHYSSHHSINISPSFVFDKVVPGKDGGGRGGYCMENSTLFATVLRSLGYVLFSAGARVSDESSDAREKEGYEGPRYMGWNHMVNIVTISSQRYLVDVGFGSSGPHHPVPLLPGVGVEEPNVGEQVLKLSYEAVEDCVDPSQRFWVYRYRHSNATPWIIGYCFSEVEFLPADFEVMNLGTSMIPGFFTENVMCVKMLMDEIDNEDGGTDGKGNLVGDITLFGSEVKRRIGGKSGVMQVFETETDRLEALKKWFGIVLSEEEISGIIGMQSELK